MVIKNLENKLEAPKQKQEEQNTEEQQRSGGMKR